MPAYTVQERMIDAVINHKDVVDRTTIPYYKMLTETFISRHRDEVNWNAISNFTELSEEFIEHFGKRINWKAIHKNCYLSERFVQKHYRRLNMKEVLKKRGYSEDIHNKLIREEIMTINEILEIDTQNVNEKTIKSFITQVDFVKLLKSKTELSDKFKKDFDYELSIANNIIKDELIGTAG